MKGINVGNENREHGRGKEIRKLWFVSQGKKIGIYKLKKD